MLGPHLPLSVGGTLALTLSHEINRGPVETAGAALGVGGISLELLFAVDGVTLARSGAHTRFNVLGFLGLTIVGVSSPFCPPAVANFRGGGDRTAALAMALLAGLFRQRAG